MKSWSASTCVELETNGQLSAVSATPSWSESAHRVGSSGNASEPVRMPSPSRSGSHGSPRPSWSESVWVTFAASGQLSLTSATVSSSSSLSAASPMPSWSVSRCSSAFFGNASDALGHPSLSMSGSQASPTRSLS